MFVSFPFQVELERQRMRHRDDQGMLTSENEELANKIDELKSEIVSVIADYVFLSDCSEL